jgi:hypothetical protein
MLRAIRNTVLALSAGLLISGFLSIGLPLALISVNTLLSSGIAAGAIGIGLEVISHGRSL